MVVLSRMFRDTVAFAHCYRRNLRFFPQLVTMGGPTREQVEICARGV